jgi:hypothetical protein
MELMCFPYETILFLGLPASQWNGKQKSGDDHGTPEVSGKQRKYCRRVISFKRGGCWMKASDMTCEFCDYYEPWESDTPVLISGSGREDSYRASGLSK